MPLNNRPQRMSPQNGVSIILLLPFVHFYILQLPEEMNHFQGNGGSGDYRTGVTRPSSSFSSYGYRANWFRISGDENMQAGKVIFLKNLPRTFLLSFISPHSLEGNV